MGLLTNTPFPDASCFLLAFLIARLGWEKGGGRGINRKSSSGVTSAIVAYCLPSLPLRAIAPSFHVAPCEMHLFDMWIVTGGNVCCTAVQLHACDMGWRAGRGLEHMRLQKRSADILLTFPS